MNKLPGRKGALNSAHLLVALTLWSSGAFAQSYSRTDTVTYEDNLSKWVIGQPKTSTNVETGRIESRVDFDPASELPIRAYRFEVLQNSFTHNPDGTPATVKDGAGNTVTLSSWKRGIPQSIKYPATPDSPTGAVQSAVVDNFGQLSSATNQAGFSTGYIYDSMGRLARVAYPTNDDVAWGNTTYSFAPVASIEFGIPAGHWKSTKSTGTGRTITHFDALWRPVLVQTEDTAKPGSVSFVLLRFDVDGQEVFRSYPASSVGTVADSLPGVTTSYDVLGRPKSVGRDSESGILTTSYQYLAGFKTQVTDPQNIQSTIEYQVFDAPSTAVPVRIVNGIGKPEQQTTVITRDVFGKPLTVTRSGS